MEMDRGGNSYELKAKEFIIELIEVIEMYEKTGLYFPVLYGTKQFVIAVIDGEMEMASSLEDQLKSTGIGTK